MADRSDKSIVDSAKETVGEVKNKVSEALQPGDLKSTAHHLPPDQYERRLNRQNNEKLAKSRQDDKGRDKGMLDSARETVSKALGGDGRDKK